MGICASGGYVPFAAQTDHRIKAVATVSGVDMGSVFRDGLTGGRDAAVLQAMLDQAGALRTEEARGKTAHLERVVPETEEGLDQVPDMYREAHYYYRTPRGQHPRSENWWVLRTVDMIAQYDSYGLIELIWPRPLLMIAGSRADTRHFSEKAIARAKDSKELFITAAPATSTSTTSPSTSTRRPPSSPNSSASTSPPDRREGLRRPSSPSYCSCPQRPIS